MPNRKISPKISEDYQISLTAPQVLTLDNGIPVYEISMGTQDVLKVELVFFAGRPYEHKKLVGRATTAMLKEGTQHTSAADLAEKVDFYGGTISTPVNLDSINVVLYCLTKHFGSLLPLFAEMIYQPAFLESELRSYVKNNQQRVIVDLTKNDVVAYRKITEFIYGKDHPYGYNSFPETYGDLERSDLEQHHKDYFTSDNCKIFLSGRSNRETLPLLNQYFGQEKSKKKTPPTYFAPKVELPQRVNLSLPNSLQTAIRVGRGLFDKKHPDFNGFYMLNMILGGFFGSRLMTNIREEKGYTYNIFSMVDTMSRDGYFYIGTEVGNQVVAPTIKEIYAEIEELQRTKVSAEELKMTRNYVLGNTLTMLDGAFNTMDLVKTLILEDIPLQQFEALIHTVKHIDAATIRNLAQKYLNREDLWEVIVGP